MSANSTYTIALEITAEAQKAEKKINELGKTVQKVGTPGAPAEIAVSTEKAEKKIAELAKAALKIGRSGTAAAEISLQTDRAAKQIADLGKKIESVQKLNVKPQTAAVNVLGASGLPAWLKPGGSSLWETPARKLKRLTMLSKKPAVSRLTMSPPASPAHSAARPGYWDWPEG